MLGSGGLTVIAQNVVERRLVVAFALGEALDDENRGQAKVSTGKAARPGAADGHAP